MIAYLASRPDTQPGTSDATRQAWADFASESRYGRAVAAASKLNGSRVVAWLR
jgi:hypothetical protein